EERMNFAPLERKKEYRKRKELHISTKRMKICLMEWGKPRMACLSKAKKCVLALLLFKPIVA
ncbi:MAG: hypothetical protein RRX93_06905, partial [Bacteroidales bacterium]